MIYSCGFCVKIQLELYIDHLAVPSSQTELRDEVVNLEGLYKCWVYMDMYMMSMEHQMYIMCMKGQMYMMCVHECT